MKISTIVKFFIPKKSTIIAWVIITPILFYLCNEAYQKGFEDGVKDGLRNGVQLTVQKFFSKMTVEEVRKFSSRKPRDPQDPNVWIPTITVHSIKKQEDPNE